MLTTCVVGLGQMGRNHARVLSDLAGVRLVAVADSQASPDVVPRGVMLHTDLREMLLAHRPDVVTVSVPTPLHCEITCAALEAGAHVLVEKPIASTREEADRMAACAATAGKLLMVGHVERFNPAVLALHAAVASGPVGRIFQLHARRLGPFPARVQDVGVVLDLATHDIDVMHFLTGGVVERVAAETSHGKPERMLAGLLRFDTGAIGVLDVHWLASHKVRELTVVAEGGTYVANYLSQAVQLHRPGQDVENLAIEHREPLRAQHEHFFHCVREGTVPRISAADGRAALDVALRLLHASV